jgi:hypothetical protein
MPAFLIGVPAFILIWSLKLFLLLLGKFKMIILKICIK